MTKGNRKSSPNKFLKYTSIPIQMGVTIYLGNLLGEWCDQKFGSGDGLYTQLVTLLAVFLAMFQVIREVIRLTNDDNKK